MYEMDLFPKQRKEILEKFNELLNDNGAILLDVYSLKMFEVTNENALYEKSK